MYPLRAAELEAKDRDSEIRLRAGAADDTRARAGDDEDVFSPLAPEDCDSERATLVPPAVATQRDLQPDAADSIDEVLFRLGMGDVRGALAAADALMSRVPVVLMTRDQLRTEPLGYWELHLLSRIDAITTIGELLDASGVPTADVVRVVCELAERKIIALR